MRGQGLYLRLLVLFVLVSLLVQDTWAMLLPADTIVKAVPVEGRVRTLPIDSVQPVAPLPGKVLGDIVARPDSTLVLYADSIQEVIDDTLQLNRFKDWKPDPVRAMWLGMVFPGGGQIYNRKYWKLPIVYGGVVACIYAVNWNAQMLRDYSQAYQDITDNDPTTSSYLEMLPLGYDISGREEHFKTV